MTILIVEDHEAVRKLLRRQVAELAAEVFECDNGADALAVYALRQPDVVLMDIQMPGLDGFATTRRIRNAFADAKVIFVSDCDQNEFRVAAMEVGARGYVTKTDLCQLKELIRKAVQ
ncbi:MAG: response regulator [Candidatus Acidiferrum sp.]